MCQVQSYQIPEACTKGCGNKPLPRAGCRRSVVFFVESATGPSRRGPGHPTYSVLYARNARELLSTLFVSNPTLGSQSVSPLSQSAVSAPLGGSGAPPPFPTCAALHTVVQYDLSTYYTYRDIVYHYICTRWGRAWPNHRRWRGSETRGGDFLKLRIAPQPLSSSSFCLFVCSFVHCAGTAVVLPVMGCS